MTAQLLLDRPDNSIADQILDCFPSGSYALSALLRLMDIVEADTVPTAAVEWSSWCTISLRQFLAI